MVLNNPAAGGQLPAEIRIPNRAQPSQKCVNQNQGRDDPCQVALKIVPNGRSLLIEDLPEIVVER